MTYPLAHKIDTSRPYTNAANTDIRILFEKVRNAKNSKQPVLATDLIPAGTSAREKPDRSSW